MADEVEIYGDDEVEVVPLSPLRKMEKRLERLEGQKSMGSLETFTKEVLSMVRSSQKLVDDVVTANHEVLNEIRETNSKLGELVDLIKHAGEEEHHGMSAEAFSPVVDKLDQLIESNQALAARMDKQSRGSGKSTNTKVKLPLKRKDHNNY